MKRTIAGLVLVLWAQAGSAGFKSGNKLLEACTSLADGGPDAYCLGYVAAAADTHDIWTFWGFIKKQVICVPFGATNGQLAQVVMKYMKERPELLHETASSAVLNALIAAFPCE